MFISLVEEIFSFTKIQAMITASCFQSFLRPWWCELPVLILKFILSCLLRTLVINGCYYCTGGNGGRPIKEHLVHKWVRWALPDSNPSDNYHVNLHTANTRLWTVVLTLISHTIFLHYYKYILLRWGIVARMFRGFWGEDARFVASSASLGTVGSVLFRGRRGCRLYIEG